MDAVVLTDVDPIDTQMEVNRCPIEPCGQRIVVKEYVVSKTACGLLIPSEYQKNSSMQTNAGVVIALGPNAEGFEVGDAVYYGRYSGAFIEINRIGYRVMNDEDVIGRIREVSNG